MFRIIKNITLLLCLILNAAYMQAHAQHNIETLYQASPTEVMVSFLRDLTENHKVTEADLIRFQTQLEKGELTNPILESEALASSELYYPWQTFNENLEQSTIADFDISSLQHHIAELVGQIKKEQDERSAIDAEIEAASFREMRFAPIQSGVYKSRFLNRDIFISEPFEILDTPVTQHQWAQIFEYLPATFSGGERARLIDINDFKIKMNPTYPVETVSYHDIETFIETLNERQDGYVYRLPSLTEYEAVISSALGDDWLQWGVKEFKPYIVCGVETTQSAMRGRSLMVEGHRIWSLFGNVWEVTRECFKEDLLVFGGAFDSFFDDMSFTELCRPYSKNNIGDNHIGFRLVRYKTGEDASLYVQHLHQKHDSWKNIIDKDPHWVWDEQHAIFVLKSQYLRFMLEHRKDYAGTLRVTLDELCSDKHVPAHEDPLTYLIAKKALNLNATLVSDLSPLAYLVNLKQLYLAGASVSDVSPLANLVNLEELILAETRIADVSPLAGLTNLKKLDLGKTQVSNISLLANLVNLEELWIAETRIADVSPLANLLKLKILHCHDTPVSDISSLASLNNLGELGLSGTQVSDISSLAGLDLKWLSLSRTKVSDLSVLRHFTNLEELGLYKIPVSDISALLNLTNLRGLYLDSNYAQLYNQTLQKQLSQCHINSIKG